jgi:hypothetical protein
MAASRSHERVSWMRYARVIDAFLPLCTIGTIPSTLAPPLLLLPPPPLCTIGAIPSTLAPPLLLLPPPPLPPILFLDQG